MFSFFTKMPLFVKIGIGLILVGVLLWGGSSIRQSYNHYKWGKSDAQVAATLQKSAELEKQSAELKAKADQLEKLAETKDAEIADLVEQSKKFGAKAAEEAKKVEDAYNNLEKDTAIINSSTDDELRIRICTERAKLGFAPIGQCKGFKLPTN